MGRARSVPTPRPPRTWDEAPAVMEVGYAALILNITPRTLQRLIQNGEIPARRVGERKYIIDKELLRQWVTGEAAQTAC